MSLSLATNDIRSEGVQYLAFALRKNRVRRLSSSIDIVHFFLSPSVE